jgi:hypothetical protein
MKRLLLSAFFTFSLSFLFAQKVDSIYFHLYTDSLKKGQYNYINVDGKLSDGRWMPLTSKEIQFTCNAASFSGNELIIPQDFNEEKVTVKAVLKNNPAIWIERTIWIKKLPDGPLPTRNDVLPTSAPSNKRKKRN